MITSKTMQAAKQGDESAWFFVVHAPHERNTGILQVTSNCPKLARPGVGGMKRALYGVHAFFHDALILGGRDKLLLDRNPYLDGVCHGESPVAYAGDQFLSDDTIARCFPVMAIARNPFV